MSIFKKDNNLNASISTHESNKKEAFEGMRAYHRSEIDHKKDAISIFQTLIASVLVLYAGLISAIYSGNINDHQWLVISVGWFIFLILATSSTALTYLTNKKINRDNTRYEKFRYEYALERKALKLEEDLMVDGCNKLDWQDSITDPPSRSTSGYSYTKKIIIGLNIIVCCIGLSGAAVVTAAILNPGKSQISKPVHIIIDSAAKTR